MTDQDRTRPTGDDDDSRRFFTDPATAQNARRHRRRRAPGDPTTTGSIPIVHVDRSLPDPTIEYRTPQVSADSEQPYFQVRYRSADPTAEYTTQDPVRYRESAPQPPREPQMPREPQTVRQPQPPRASEPATVPFSEAPPAAPATSAPPRQEESHRRPEPNRAEPVRAVPVVVTPTDDLQGHSPMDDVDTGELAVVGGAMPERKRRGRGLLIGLAVLAVVVVLAAGVFVLRWFGVFESTTDFDSATGQGAVLVEVAPSAPISAVGTTLADAGVVGSQRAFIKAADGGSGVSPGYYVLPKGISADSALTMMSGPDHRVGRFVVPEGQQLDSKKGADGSIRPGIFQMIAKATTFTTDDQAHTITVEELQKAAATATPEQLGVPEWARARVAELTGDHRRIEGLIASGAWEEVDPRLDATGILRELITRSVTRFTAWGLLNSNNSGLSPYDTLTVASIVEAEARHEEDFPKVARVILNRLNLDRRLEMDSTANYTAAVSNIDLHGESYLDDNKWNTYHHKGLPITPIGAVGQQALLATEEPAPGKWLYFVTVDKEGTTLFSVTFGQHTKNREVACKNKFLTVGCA